MGTLSSSWAQDDFAYMGRMGARVLLNSSWTWVLITRVEDLNTASATVHFPDSKLWSSFCRVGLGLISGMDSYGGS